MKLCVDIMKLCVDIMKLCVDIIYLEQAGDETHLQLVGQPHVLAGPGLTRQLDVSKISA